MIPPPTPTYSNSSGLRKWIIGCFFVCPLVCCLGTVLIGRRWVDVFDQSRQLESFVAVAKKNNFPFEAKDLARSPAVPDSQNAKASVVAFTKKVGSKSGLSKELTAYKTPTDKPLPKVIADFAEEAKKIATYPAFDSQKDLDMGTNVKFPEYVMYKNLMRALGLCAECDAAHGKSTEAIKDLQGMRQLIVQMSKEENAIGALVVMAMDQIYYRACVKVGQSFASHPTDLATLKSEVSRPLPEPSMKTCLRSEFYEFLCVSRNDKLYRKLGDDFDEKAFKSADPQRSGLPKSAVWRGQLASAIQQCLALDAILTDSPNLAEASKKMKAYYDTKVPKTASNYVPSLMFDMFPETVLAGERHRVSKTIAVRFVDLLIERGHGGFPEKIAPIADSYAGGNLIYRRTKDGFKLYSIGRNLKDDGGPKNTTDRKNSDDTGYEYPFTSK